MSEIKKELCYFFNNIKESDNLTYDQIESITRLTRLQISNVLNKNGHKVSVERLEQALNKLGYEVAIEVCKTCG